MKSTLSRESADRALDALRKRFAEDKPEYQVCIQDDSCGLCGYLVIWNLPHQADPVLGSIAKGGTRIVPDLELETIERLAKAMALKNATANLPLGGAKSGIRANPDSPDFEKTYRCFARKLSPLLAENGGPFGGFGFDIGARPEHPLWICDELHSTRSFTGKPSHMGGTDYDKEGIAGLGVATAAKCTMEHFGEVLSSTSYAVQGLGAMGAGVIRYFSEFSTELRYISDPRLGGTFHLAKGASTELLQALSAMDFDTSARLLASGNSAALPIDEILYTSVDILFPCAVQDVITEENASKIHARYIIEGANNPVSEAAKPVLDSLEIVRIPGEVANPGGIIAAFVELQSGAGVTPPTGMSLIEYAKSVVRERISDNVSSLLALAKELTWSPATSAEALAYSRLYPESEESVILRSLQAEHVSS